MYEFLTSATTFLSGLLTPVLAILTAYIAWQQWTINRRRLDRDRYERRLRIYEATKTFLAKIMREAKPEFKDISLFITETAEADFLFGAEIPRYLNELRTRANDLRIANDQYRDYSQAKPEGYDHEKIVNTEHEELLWLAEQFDREAKNKFAKYLRIGS